MFAESSGLFPSLTYVSWTRQGGPAIDGPIKLRHYFSRSWAYGCEMTEKTERPSRNYFRLEYPKEARPQIAIGDGKFPVINLSEKGVKFSFDPRRSTFILDTEHALDATIIFQDHGHTRVTGRILRIDSNAVVLELTEGVPLQRIMTEQRILLNKFGNLKRPFEG